MNISSLSGVTKAVVALGAGGVLAGAIALGASGGNGGGASPPAQAVAATATSVPEQNQGGAQPGPRQDCPANWTSYVDPDNQFSLCFPVEMRFGVGEGEPGGSKAITIMTAQPPGAVQALPNSIVFTIYWKPSSPFQRSLISERCKNDRASFGLSTREEAFPVGKRQATACVGIGSNANSGVEPISIETPDLVGKGFVQIFAFQTGPDVGSSKGLIQEILRTVRLQGE
jgi:hypothetical protein